MKANSIPTGLAVHARTITTTRHLIVRLDWLWSGLLAFAMIAFGPQPALAAMTEAWVQRYGSEAGSADEARKVVTDAAGNVIVAGTTMHNQTGSGSDLLVIKYSDAGAPLWTNRYDGSVSAVAVDASGNVFVAGTYGIAGARDYATIAYSGAGVPLWTNRYNGSANRDDYASALAVDGSGNVFVTGGSTDSEGNHDYATIAYSGAGAPLWTNRYNGPANRDDYASALAVDASGNVFVTGSSHKYNGSVFDYDYATIAYSGAGVPLWTKRYNGPANRDDFAYALAVDGSGNVFVTGCSGYFDGVDWVNDYATIAYSGAGVPLWTKRYNGPGNGDDGGNAVAVDSSGNVFVTGYSVGSGGYSDYATIAYSGAGVPLWTNRYNGPASSSDFATALAVDASGNVFVTGSSYVSGGEWDYATIKYSGAGVPLWTNRYNGPASSGDFAHALAVDISGNVFVTGSSLGSGGDSDYATIGYSGAGAALWTNRYGGRGAASDGAKAVAVDVSGNLFVTGNLATIAYSSAGAPLWTNRGSGVAIALGASGSVFVTGGGDGGDPDYATIAYSAAGVPLWTNRYDGGSAAIAVDGSGNVFVTGTSATIAYSGAGVPLWTNLNDGGAAIAVDSSGNVFVTGTSLGSGGDSDYATVAYSGAGVPLWTNRYNGPDNGNDKAEAVAVDASGNVFVTGWSGDSCLDCEWGGSDYATVAYSGDGVPLWTNRYHGPDSLSDKATAIAVDGNGKVFVTGTSERPFRYPHSATIAYSGGGVPLWTNHYNGASAAVAVDGSGNVFVTGPSVGSGGYFDYATIAYSGLGVPLWTNRYNGTANRHDRPSSLAIGSDGAVYVTGDSDGLSLPDFATVKYVWQTEIAIQLLATTSPKVNLTLSGAPNSSWAIERALAPTGPWTNQSALLIGTNGSAQFQDTNPPSPAGFYRARQ